jgi:hypothetical protein
MTLARPGIVAVRRGEGWVEATAAAGVRLDEAWAGADLDRISVCDGAGALGPPIPLAEPGVAPDALVRGQARRLGTRLVTIRFEHR